MIPYYIGANMDLQMNELYIQTDAGRLCRPLFYIDEIENDSIFKKIASYEILLKKIEKGETMSWYDILCGTHPKKLSWEEYQETIKMNPFLTSEQLYGKSLSIQQLQHFQSVVEYLDNNEFNLLLFIKLFLNILNIMILILLIITHILKFILLLCSALWAIKFYTQNITPA